MNKYANVNRFIFALFFSIVSSHAFAGGLDDATTALTEIKTWLYGFLGVGAFVYLLYQLGMALMEKNSWADVGMALGKVAAAGGIIIAGEWAYSIWG